MRWFIRITAWAKRFMRDIEAPDDDDMWVW